MNPRTLISDEATGALGHELGTRRLIEMLLSLSLRGIHENVRGR